jgi:transposase
MIHQRIGKALELLKQRRRILPKSPLGKAISYILRLWPRLSVFLDDGRVEIDTNLVENAIRPSAAGKKNWLFIGSEESGWKAAVFHTLIANCRHLGIDPHAYLTDVLERLPITTNWNVEELLPAAWAGKERPKCLAAS